jgi:tRNA/tmRNA/rRNA uracil-C5-methylase (TrmA/RlmC/RlmD family)
MDDAAQLLSRLGLLPLATLPRAEQRARAEARVRQAFARVQPPVTIAPIVASPRETGARARVKLRADAQGRLGFHAAGSHAWHAVDLALLARPEVVTCVQAVEAWGGARGEVEIRSDGSRAVVVLEAPPAAPLDGLSLDVALGDRRLCGDPVLRVGGLRVSPRSFYQVNLEINAAIVDAVDAELQRLAPAHLLDLYAGIGNLSARAVRRGVPATLVEQAPSSVADARVNCPGAKVLCADAGRVRAGEHFADVVILDPPRAGAPGLLPKLLLTRPRAVVYLSCEPTTLVRDLGPVLAAGYALTSVRPWEMFPGTDHVETLVVAERDVRGGVAGAGPRPS